MNFKEANSDSFSKQKSYYIKKKKEMTNFFMGRDSKERTHREALREFKVSKPKRSSSGGVPRNRMNIGNSLKTYGCNYCFLSLTNAISKKKMNKTEIKFDIALSSF